MDWRWLDASSSSSSLSLLGPIFFALSPTTHPPTHSFLSQLAYLSAWDLVDIFLIVSAVWMFHSYLVFHHLANGIKNQWLLNAETAAFMASRVRPSPSYPPTHRSTKKPSTHPPTHLPT